MSAIRAGGCMSERRCQSEIQYRLMQPSHLEIKEKLLKALDGEYNVVDMGAVIEIISILEHTPVTKEVLEVTRLGRYINELRRKTRDESLAKRAKDLVRKWRNLISQDLQMSVATSQTSSASPHLKKNGYNVVSPIAREPKNSAPPSSNSSSPVFNSRYQNVSNRSGGASFSSFVSTSPPVNNQSSSLLFPTEEKQCNTSPSVSSKLPRLSKPESHIETITSSNAASYSDAVPKTCIANKRLRKQSVSLSEDEPPFKVSNGVSPMSAYISHTEDIVSECSRDSFGGLSDNGSVGWDVCTSSFQEVPKETVNKDSSSRTLKRVSSKVSKQNNVSQNKVDDLVKEKIALIARTPKVKTTQELLAGLQAKPISNCRLKEEVVTSKSCKSPSDSKASLSCLRKSPKCEERGFSQVKSESSVSAFTSRCKSVKSTSSDKFKGATHSSENLIQNTSNPVGENIFQKGTLGKESSCPDQIDPVDKDIHRILSNLPPIDHDISWDEPGVVKSEPPDEAVVENLVKQIQNEHMEGLNGNFDDCPGDSESNFREWHETVSRKSYQGELLHILPYVVID